MNVREMVKYVEKNYETITGWHPDGMDEEKPFNENVYELLEDHHIDRREFQKTWNEIRGGQR